MKWFHLHNFDMNIVSLPRPSPPLAQRAHQRHHARYQHGATVIAES